MGWRYFGEVETTDPTPHHEADARTGMEIELARIFGGREIELRTYEDVSRYFRDEIRAAAESVYVAA